MFWLSHNVPSTLTDLLTASLVLPNIAHSTDIAHGIPPNKHGAKYMLILKHHFNRPDKAGVIRLSKELVDEAVAKKKV